ncbi:hypothetical protein TrLO_g10024 [Triparma laevis f. longispina]|uniref:GST N-terminal domain-containing protein n=1 Tax=Triparma laevis f. longispina TaxID=1714387 RepID=A0A9W7DSV8_9STRA|nr:hypothetical protein TrLO_g10024 [Triparma laevis f. longispina]
MSTMLVALLFLLSLSSTLSLSLQNIKLYDIPVSNHGARIRMIINSKKLNIQVLSPMTELGGLKSEEYLALNPQGKMPLLTLPSGLSIPESDTISRYLLSSTSTINPTFLPSTIHGELLSNQIIRLHDIYISPIQGCMYRALGSGFGRFGDNRQAAYDDLIKQLSCISDTIKMFYSKHKDLEAGRFLVGDEISLADATLFPTLCFTEYMLPKFFDHDEYNHFLQKYFDLMRVTETGFIIKEEIYEALDAWHLSGRWDTIVEEGVGPKKE